MMLIDRIERIAIATAAIKQEIHDTLMAQAPANKGLWFTIMVSEIENGILSAGYYNTYGQLHRLAVYAAEKPERSLETILNTFQAVVDTGRSPAFKDVQFNKETRQIIQALF